MTQFDNIDANKALEILRGNKLGIDNTKPSKYNNIDDQIIEEMKRQSQIIDSLDINNIEK